MNAASNWSDKIPSVTGTYLVQYTGDWFPEGDRNNIKHELVDLVTDGKGGPIRVLSFGRFLEESEMKGWKFAKVRKAGNEVDEVLLVLRECEQVFIGLHDDRLRHSLRRVRNAIKHYAT